ncbi:phenoloxidase-activating enzyme-like [Hyposmocoma kahamanoa]|uniref:phenoloxidase-activating enzyme-like n=1 Tax=Hyposmocoma kahamanoa TaxID=1477025 RepID=UPI000E6D8AAD|nr:phenoloxidase-activating enzyme-like [Hyposmocoma kahamanoa]
MNWFLLISGLVTSYLCVVEGYGDKTNIDEYPWLVLIEYPKDNTVSLSCGGSLISDRYVLTATYCVVGPITKISPPRNVRLGEYDKSNEVDQPDCVTSTDEGASDCNDGAIVIPIEKIIAHPEYNPEDTKTRKHDIALIRMSKSAPYTDFIRPISLPTSDITLSPPSGLQLIEAGWATAYSRDKPSDVKVAVKLPFVPLSECQTAYNNKAELWQGQICAGGKEGKYSCIGDGGGPLVWENSKPDGSKVFEIVGIVSFGMCRKENVPYVYTKVYDYNSWIRETIKS